MNESRHFGRTTAAIAIVAMAAAALASSVIASPPGSFAASDIRVTAPIVNFGAVAPGELKTRMLSITNVSGHSIRIALFGIDEPPPYVLFQWRVGLAWPPCPEITGPDGADLAPGATCKFPVWVQPAADAVAGTYEAVFEIDMWNNLIQEPLLRVPLSVKVR